MLQTTTVLEVFTQSGFDKRERHRLNFNLDSFNKHLKSMLKDVNLYIFFI